jgi:hypothetical protein
LEPTQVQVVTILLPAVEVLVPSPEVEVQGLLPTVEVVESSSVRASLTVEEMMDLETCRYIDFPGVEVIDLEAPQLPEKEYKVVVEWRSNERMIMETITLVSKALQKYERVDTFASTAATKAGYTVLAAPAAHVEPSVSVF